MTTKTTLAPHTAIEGFLQFFFLIFSFCQRENHHVLISNGWFLLKKRHFLLLRFTGECNQRGGPIEKLYILKSKWADPAKGAWIPIKWIFLTLYSMHHRLSFALKDLNHCDLSLIGYVYLSATRVVQQLSATSKEMFWLPDIQKTTLYVLLMGSTNTES